MPPGHAVLLVELVPVMVVVDGHSSEGGRHCIGGVVAIGRRAEQIVLLVHIESGSDCREGSRKRERTHEQSSRRTACFSRVKETSANRAGSNSRSGLQTGESIKVQAPALAVISHEQYHSIYLPAEQWSFRINEDHSQSPAPSASSLSQAQCKQSYRA